MTTPTLSVSRRPLVATFAAATMLALSGYSLSTLASDQANGRKHAMSLVGAPKMAPDFKHFDWVNPNAPKAGRFRMYAAGTYDSFNQFAVLGVPTGAVTLTVERLFSTTPDEASTAYASIAEWVSYPADYSAATFSLRPGLKFHDGKPITVDDVIFSLEAIKKASPNYRAYWADVVSAEKTGEREVTFKFKRAGNREMPHIVGEIPVLAKHFWEAKGADGETRDLTRPLREPPVGSGPYRIKSFDMGRGVVLERVKDWWGTDLPVHKGQWNFDEIHLVYFQQRIPGFETFKRGDLDYWAENSAKSWATEYNFNAVTSGNVQLHRLPIKRVAPMQAFVMNTRKKVFQDIRVRRAFQLAFDFEDANKSLFFGQYIRVGSFFDNSEMAAKGLPAGRELEILKEVEAKGLPPEVFTTEWKNPVNNTPQEKRANLAAATKLLAEAGYTVKNGTLVNATGEPLAVEFMIQSDGTWERLIKPFADTLKLLGVQGSVRVVDTAQYQARKDKFEFDIIIDSYPQSESPGNEQRDYWGTAAADLQGSRNTAGIKNAAVDALVDKIIYAKDRAELVAATQALDRVLLWQSFVVPQWHLPFERFAIWNQYGRPEKLPSRQAQVIRTWWFDQALADKLKR
jgi:microcin C transport system substrate-binding protein